MKKLLLLFTLCLGYLSYSQTARVQVIHNSPDAMVADVDIYINGNLAIDNFKFRTATPYIVVPAGSPIIVDIAPGNSTSVADAIITETYTLIPDATYVAVANGMFNTAGYSPARAFTFNAVTSGRETGSDSASTDILVHHGSPDAPSVNIVTVGSSETMLVNDLKYSRFTDYLELPTENYTIEVTNAAGTATLATYDLPLQTLGLNGVAVTAVASGFVDPSNNNDGPEFGIWVALPAGGAMIPLPLVSLAVKNSDLNAFKLHPNPVSNILNVQGINLQNMTLDIFDIQGRRLNSNAYRFSNSNSIDVSQLSNGLYHLILTDDQMNSNVRKFIKK